LELGADAAEVPKIGGGLRFRRLQTCLR
jgi:hypothetical protein